MMSMYNILCANGNVNADKKASLFEGSSVQMEKFPSSSSTYRLLLPLCHQIKTVTLNGKCLQICWRLILMRLTNFQSYSEREKKWKQPNGQSHIRPSHFHMQFFQSRYLLDFPVITYLGFSSIEHFEHLVWPRES